MRVTLKDIAREAGLSTSAVSLVLNNKPCRVSKENKRRIIEIAQRRNYAANQMARSLVTKKTGLLALVLPDIENSFFSSIAKRLEDCCRAGGYALILANSNDRQMEERNLLHHITTHGADGMFLIAANESLEDARLEKKDGSALPDILHQLPMPYVVIDRWNRDFSCDQVYFDNRQGALLAVRHLLENGHRQIGCVTNLAAANGRARFEGYKQALVSYGLTPNPALVAQGDYRFESGYRCTQSLLEAGATAVFSCNELMALGIMKFLYERAIRVPEDLSIVSYDNSIAPLLPGMALTSIDQDAGKLGEKAYMLLSERLMGFTGAPRVLCLPPELKVRGSVGQIELCVL